jgi:hypothetical protein
VNDRQQDQGGPTESRSRFSHVIITNINE